MRQNHALERQAPASAMEDTIAEAEHGGRPSPSRTGGQQSSEAVRHYLESGGRNDVFRLAFSLTKDANEADEVAQNACLAGLVHQQQLKDPERVGGWMASIVRTQFLQDVRKEKSQNEVLSINSDPTGGCVPVACEASPSTRTDLEPGHPVTKIEQGLQSNCPKLGDYFAVGNEVGWDDRHQIAERLGITGQKERNTLDRLKKHLWRDILDWTTADALPPLYGELGEALRRANPRQWREGNTALYATLQRATREYPRTIEEMAPLYEAVMHGCEAGLYREALNEVYRRRIQRGTEAFNTKKLGAIQAELAVLAGFFEQRWDQPVAGLTETEKGYVLHEAGYALRGLGRLRDAITPMKLSVEKACALKMWDDAALRASNSSGLHLSLGNLAQALEYARLSMQWAVRSGDPIERLGKMARLGDTLHQMGRWKAAGVAFAVAEEIQRAQEPGFPFLYSFWGFWYCDLLLGQGKYREVQKRARRALERAERAGILFDLALCHLILGRAELALSVQDKKGERLPQAAWHLDQAIDILRKASVRDYLPRALLARAELRRSTGELDGSRADLTDGFVIATSGQMLRHEADYHLGYAALYAAWGKKSKARANLAAAEALIGRMQYDRRKGSLHRLSAKLE